MMREGTTKHNGDVEIWTDASGSWGCEGFWAAWWFQVAWSAFAKASRHLEGLVRDLVTESLASSTRKAGQKRYLSFCQDSHSNPFPLMEDQLCGFVAHLAEDGLKHSSIKGYLSAIPHMNSWGHG